MIQHKRLPKSNWELFSFLFKHYMSKQLVLPMASATEAGCVKIGDGLTIIDGKLTCTLTGSSSDIAFEDFTENDVKEVFQEG